MSVKKEKRGQYIAQEERMSTAAEDERREKEAERERNAINYLSSGLVFFFFFLCVHVKFRYEPLLLAASYVRRARVRRAGSASVRASVRGGGGGGGDFGVCASYVSL